MSGTGTEPNGDAATDGRRQRSERSKHKIAEAMIELIMAGDLTPSAEAVAARAGVGLRSVFRHFKDMDSLFHEVSKIFREEFEHRITTKVEGRDWKEQLMNLVTIRSETFDLVMPMQQSTVAQYHRSKFVQSEVARTNTMLRASILDILPDTLANNHDFLEGLDALMSPAMWMRLRLDQDLTTSRALDVTRKLIAAHLKAV